MLQQFQHQTLFPCTETTLTIEISNLSGVPQTGVTLGEVFQEDITVVDILYNPYTGNIGSTIGSNELLISEMIIPEGIDSIVLRIDIGEILPNTYWQQAILSGIDLPGNLNTIVVSDNPNTLVKKDSSDLTIIPLNVDLDNNQNILCEGTELVLNTVDGTGLSYLWSDGSMESQLPVSSPGLYAVTISTGCENVMDSIQVSLATLSAELGDDLIIDLGDEITLNPAIFSFGDIINFEWYKNDELMVNCEDCLIYSDQPINNAVYGLFLADEFGCEADDLVEVMVMKDYDIYAPNVFSPNNDGLNDWFFLQSKHSQHILRFQIFDRWGNLIFEKNNIMTNIPAEGWDGRFKGNLSQEGVFI